MTRAWLINDAFMQKTYGKSRLEQMQSTVDSIFNALPKTMNPRLYWNAAKKLFDINRTEREIRENTIWAAVTSDPSSAVLVTQDGNNYIVWSPSKPDWIDGQAVFDTVFEAYTYFNAIDRAEEALLDWLKKSSSRRTKH